MENITIGSIKMTWESETRLAVLRFQSETYATGKDAEVLIEALTRWIGKEGKPFGFMGDGDKLAGLDGQYRSLWSKFFRHHRKDSFIAFFNMSPLIRVAAEMFGIGTGLRLKAFASEEEARSWLRKKVLIG